MKLLAEAYSLIHIHCNKGSSSLTKKNKVQVIEDIDREPAGSKMRFIATVLSIS